MLRGSSRQGLLRSAAQLRWASSSANTKKPLPAIKSLFLWRFWNKNPSILRLPIAGALEERADNRKSFLRFVSKKQPPPLDTIFDALSKAKKDPLIKGILLDLGPMNCGLARAQELADRIRDVSSSGIPVYAQANILTPLEYYVGIHCDKLFLPPSASVHMRGFSVRSQHFRSLLDKVGVEPEVVRAGSYKTAGEAFTEKDLSPYGKEQLQALLDDAEGGFVERMCERLGRKPDFVRQMIDQGPSARMLAAEGWVSGLAYSDEVEEQLASRIGTTERPSIVMHDAYQFIPGGMAGMPARSSKDRVVAVVSIKGPILNGYASRPNSVGNADIVPLLRKARDSDKIAAVVLRVESPGGSSLASDLIWREVQLLADTKPVVASFGSVAASGGYYVATPAHHIFAQEATMTGSIGVFALRPSFEGLLHTLGINVHVLAKGRFAKLLSLNHKMSADEHEHMQGMVQEIYSDFLEVVAKGRKMSLAQVMEVAQGRVWSGRRALQNGLIDGIGGIHQAIAKAGELAGLSLASGVTQYPHLTLNPPRPFPGNMPFMGDASASDLAEIMMRRQSGGLDALAQLAVVLASSRSEEALVASLEQLLQDPRASAMMLCPLAVGTQL